MASIEPFIHRKVVVLRTDATAEQAARAICEHSIGCVLVSDHESHIVGILTDRDLVCHLIAGEKTPGASLGEIMHSPVISAADTFELEQVVHLMELHGIRRIPIIQALTRGRQHCVGMVTLDDLVASGSVSEFHQVRIIKSQLRKKMESIIQRKGVTKVIGEPEAFPAPRAPVYGFLHEAVRRAGLSSLKVPKDCAEKAVRLVLESLVRRLHHTAAMHLIALLPEGLQDQLIEIPSGPDRTVTMTLILRDLEEMLEIDSNTACLTLTNICSALEEMLDFEELGHIKAQLPDELRALFRRKQAAA
jgi:CBS domain-containing protein/uncharacterized protein (DUF2267 family)